MKRTTREQVFQKLLGMCRKRETDPTYADLMQRFPAQYGPLTSQVAEELDASKESVRCHLTALEKVGRVVRDQPYFSAIRWYVPKEGEVHGARNYRKGWRV